MRKTGLLSIAILATLVLASCHKPYNVKSFVAPSEFDMSKTYEIDFWSKNDGNSVQASVYENAISEFEKIYPNIKVNNKVYTSYDTIYRDVITNISSKTPPNVCVAYPDNVATYKTSENVIVELDSLMNNESYGLDGKDLLYDAVGSSNIKSKFLNEGIIDGSYYTLPFVRSSEALYINQNYLYELISNGYLSLSNYESYGITSYNEYGVPDIPTWDFIWAASEAAINAKSNGIPKCNTADATIYPFIYKSSDNWLIQEFKQLDYDYTYYDSYEKVGYATLFNDKTNEYLIDLATKCQSRLYQTFDTVSYPANRFNKWETLFCVDSTAGATWMGFNATSVDAGSKTSGDEFETAVRMIPQHDASNINMISQGPSLTIFNDEDSDVVVASWIFAQYLLTDDIQYNYATTEGYIPVTSSVIESEKYQNYLKKDSKEEIVKIKASKLIIDNIDNTFVTPVFNLSADVRNAAKYLVTAVTSSVKNKKYRTKAEVDELFSKAISNNNLESIVLNKTNTNKYLPIGIALICAIGLTWISLGFYVIYNKKKIAKKS